MSLVALIDIGSTSVGGALLRPHKDKRLKSRHQVAYTTRRQINFQKELTPGTFFGQVESSLKEVLTDFQSTLKSQDNKLKGSPKKVHIFLSAPFYAAQTRAIQYKLEKPTEITSKLIDGLIDEKLQRFKSEQAGQHELIENKLLSIKLNGYYIADPYGQVASELEVASYFSLGATDVLDKIRATMTAAFHHENIELHTAALVYYRVWREVLPQRDSYLLLDIGGEVTELSVTTHDISLETASFPVGGHYVIREVAKALGASLAEAAAAIKRQVKGEHYPSAANQLAEVLEKVKVEWLKAFRQSAVEARQSFFLPQRAWLIGDPDLTPLFGSWLDGLTLNGQLVTKRQLAIDYWQADWFSPWAPHDTQARQDLSLMAETIYYDRIVAHR
ncbi:MAG: hypothetical protein U9M92_00730 [Patescibacteria group bacterium]|nr:hypothetical protein [Patescibacteria group bacterium]